LLPAEVQGPKRGFNFPLATWMRDQFDGYFDEHLTAENVRSNGLFNWDYIQALRAETRSGKNDNSYPLFALIMFDAWFQKYIKR
jgi:asparagine synthase (glutamine-hydrolysing)